jgi:DNA-directed RNA polymerase specialized sigma24 family protein
MRDAPAYYAEGPEALVVNLAVRGDRDAFTELVRRRQSWLRTLFRRCSGNPTLADDLAQQVFLKAWRTIGKLERPEGFGGWIQQLALDEWMDHQRKYAEVDVRGNEAGKAADELSAMNMPLERSEQSLRGEVFTRRIASDIRHRGRRIIAARLTVVLLLIALDMLLESPLQESLGVAAQILGTPLVPIENEWLAFALAPINSLAGLLGILLTGMQFLYRKLR